MKVFRSFFIFIGAVIAHRLPAQAFETSNSDEIAAKAAEEIRIGDFSETLRGIILIDDPALLNAPIDPAFCGVEFIGDSPQRESKLFGKLDPLIGEPLIPKTLDKIRGIVTEFYHSQGYPLVGVSVPEGQDVSSGNLYVLILIAKVGKVKAVGAEHFSSDWIEKQIRLKKGDAIRSEVLINDLAWLNSNPFRTVDLIYEKGESLGQTDLLLRVQDLVPGKLFYGYENTGNLIGGDNRFVGGFNWCNLWGKGHQLNGQFVSSVKFKQWYGAGGSYIAPLPWRDWLKFFGSYIESVDPNLSDPDLVSPVQQSGKSWQIGGRYEFTLPVIGTLRHALILGYDFKRMNNFLDFGIANVFNNYFDISQFVLAYEGSSDQKSGSNVFGASLFISPGNMTAFNKSRYFSEERIGADANYIYGRATFDRITFLPWKWSWIFSSLFQWSSGKLMPTEELSLGGYATVRGYDENAIVADRGFLVKNELRTPCINFFRKGVVQDELQFLLFVDLGYGIQVDPSVYNQSTKFLGSVGPGLRYSINPYMTFRLDYGIEIDELENRPFIDPERSRVHLGVIVGFDPRGKARSN